MSIIYKCDLCGTTEENKEKHTRSSGPKEWSNVSISVKAGSNIAKSGFEKLICPSCATKHGITEVEIKEIEKDSIEKLADHLYTVVEELVEEAMDNH